MSDATTALRTPKIRQARPRRQTASEAIGGALLYLALFLALLGGAVLALPLSAGALLSLSFPRKGLPSWVGALVSGVLAYLLAFKHGLVSWETQKEAFLALLDAQKGWFLDNWPRYVTDGPKSLIFGEIPAIWAYYVFLGAILGVLFRKSGFWWLFLPWLPTPNLVGSTAPSPVSSSAVSSAPPTPPVKGGDGSPNQKTDSGREDAPAYTVTRDLFTRKEAHRYTVQEALRQARSGKRGRIGYWLHGFGIFRRVHPHLLPCTHLYRGIDLAFGDFRTRLRASYRVKGHDTAHPTVYQQPISATGTAVHGSDTRYSAVATAHWHYGNRVLPSATGNSQHTPTVYTWGDVGRVGSVELLVAPPKVGKTSLCTQLAAAQRTGAPFLGWPTVRSGLVWLVEESPSEFDAKRRRAAGLAPVIETDTENARSRPFGRDIGMERLFNLSDLLTCTLWRLCSSTIRYRVEGKKIGTFVKGVLNRANFSRSHSFAYVGRPSEHQRACTPRGLWHAVHGAGYRVALTGYRSIGDLYRIIRNRAQPSGQGRPKPGKTPEKLATAPGDLLAVLYGPSVPRGLAALADHLAVACTVATVRSRLTGVPWYTIQVDSLFHWCEEAEQDASAAKQALNLFKTVAGFGFLVRVVVHADEVTGKVKGPQNITRDADTLLHLSPLPRSARARDTALRLLSPEGRFEERPRPDPLPYRMADGNLVPLNPPEPVSEFVSADADAETGRETAPERPSAPQPAGADATNGDHDGPGASRNGKPQNGRSGGSQGHPGRAKTERNIRDLLAVCPDHGQEPRPAAELVKAFTRTSGLKPDRVYTLAREAEVRGLLAISETAGRRHQWVRTEKQPAG